MWSYWKNPKNYFSTEFFSPADLFCPHVEQDVGGREANCDAVNQQGAGVRDQGDPLQECREKKQTPSNTCWLCCLKVLTHWVIDGRDANKWRENAFFLYTPSTTRICIYNSLSE